MAAAEAQELALIEAWLPEAMTEAEIRKIAVAKQSELDLNYKAKAGLLVGAIMKATAGRADGGTVKKIVEELLS